MKSEQLVHLVKGVKKKEKIFDTQLGKWKKGAKYAIPIEAHVLMIRRESYNPRKRLAERNNSEVGQIKFPPLQNISSVDPVIIKEYVSGRQVNRAIPLVGFSGEKSWPLGEVPLKITIGEGPLITTKILNFFIVGSDSPYDIILGRTAMQQIGIVVSTIYEAIKFYMPQGISTVLSQYNPREPKEEHRATSEEHQEEVKGILSCVDIEERIVINDQYPKQRIAIGRQLPTKTKIRLQDLLRTYVDVFAWTTAHMTGVPRTVTIGGETFNIEHIINELKHLEPVKQKKRSLTPEIKRSDSNPSGGAYKGQHFTKSQVSDVDLKPFHREKSQWKMEVVCRLYGHKQSISQRTALTTQDRAKSRRPPHASTKMLFSCIQGTAEADEAFRRIKELLEALPTGAKLGYPELEKLILALVYAARRPRIYFQAHLIQVLSDKPIKQILAKPKKSRRIAKWAIKLGEHEIEFRGRNSVKGQILADFLAETPSKEEERSKDEEAKKKRTRARKSMEIVH
uniref:Reverse transcriptase RNase H-like domain-containing protein n=1 Tax=Tanacetum cinerariifolium TaxID=118510 RepID=A0A699IQU1_TANCI|nr:hypothetical protein [Tanacetum cinerariifolium]